MSDVGIINQENKALLEPMQIPESLERYVLIRTKNYPGGFVVKTYSVFATNKNDKILKHGPDDQTFINHPDLIPLIPRGCSELYKSNDLKHPICKLRGLPKFDGTSSIDEDELPFEGASEEEPITSLFPSNLVKQWEDNSELLVEFKEKANGKFAIFKLFKNKGIDYIYGGTKNVHAPHKLFEPTPVINGKKELHYEILDAIMEDLKKLSPQQLEFLFDKTVIGEYVDGKHMIYTPVPYMVYFNEGLNLPEVKDIFPPSTTLPTQEQLKCIRDMTDIEGVVIKYTNKRTGETYLQKHKTKWYIIIRCWRELISKLNKENVRYEKLFDLILEKLWLRSGQFLHLTSKENDYWEEIGDKFSGWLYQSKYAYSDLHPFSGIGIAKVWKEFNEDLAKGWTGPVYISDYSEFESDDPIEYLNNPDFYNLVISTASRGFKVVVVMSGPPGSGKTTVAKKLLDDLKMSSITAERFSTDDLFIDPYTKEYKFDPKLLEYNHGQNFGLFVNSDAQVKIIDNTNLAKWEYDRYTKHQPDAICIMLAMKEQTAEVLAKRNIHGLDVNSLKKSVSKYKPCAPAYYGLFPYKTFLLAVIKSLNINLQVTQKTPLHVTVKFVGGDKKKDNPDHPDLLGTEVLFSIVGYSINEAGHCLVVEVKQLDGNHITLHTNENFKPADVGKGINENNITPVNMVIQSGLYLPMW
jgi:hypothetical protein